MIYSTSSIDRATHTKEDGVKDNFLGLPALAKKLVLFSRGLQLVSSVFLHSTRVTRVTKEKRPQSRRSTASLFINAHKIMNEKRKSIVILV